MLDALLVVTFYGIAELLLMGLLLGNEIFYWKLEDELLVPNQRMSIPLKLWRLAVLYGGVGAICLPGWAFLLHVE